MKTVYQLDDVFYKENSLSHKYYEFEVEKDYNNMVISYSYLPKKYEDYKDSINQIIACYAGYNIKIDEKQCEKELPLNNLITISIDSPQKPLGGAHRHLNTATYYINENNSSKGFLNSRVYSGKWRLCLSFHAVLTDSVNVKVRVDCYD